MFTQRGGDNTRYTAENPTTIDGVIKKAENENKILEEMSKGNLSSTNKQELSEQFPGFKISVPQDLIISTDIQKFTPDTNSDFTQKIRFKIEPADYVNPTDFQLHFKLQMVKNMNSVPKALFAVGVGGADLNFIPKISLRENFVFHFIKGVRCFFNEATNNANPCNNFLTDPIWNRFKADQCKKNYNQLQKQLYLNKTMGCCRTYNPLSPFTRYPSVASSLARGLNGLILDENALIAQCPEYTTEMRNNFFSTNEIFTTGIELRIPLFELVPEIFDIDTFLGKNKTISLEFYIENDMNQILEFLRPITNDEKAAFVNAGVIINEPVIYANSYKLKSSWASQKTSYILSNGNNAPYVQNTFPHFEKIVYPIDNATQSYIVTMSNNKTSEVVPHQILISCLNKFETDHATKQCFSPRELAPFIIKKITFENFRRNFTAPAGSTVTFDLDNSFDRFKLFQYHVSFCKGNSPSTLNMKNITEAMDIQDDTFIQTAEQFYSESYNLNQPIAIDCTSDYNYVKDKPPAVIAGSNSFRIVLEFRQPFAGYLTVFCMVPAQIVETGTGISANLAYYPEKYRQM